MDRLEFLRDKADNIWYQHTLKQTWETLLIQF